ncbi:MAG: 5-(carboxyamino)imidazole ribonucleotide synthase [Dethiosulfatibacter sp.]|nr:5-(carboxyamino)imidazole ribonucleotide synthase [Dethiosulfatibacter sp.]
MIKRKIDKLYPPSTIGVIGGGQLGKMIVCEAKRMGYNAVVLDPKTNSPAGQVADEQIVAGFDEIWAYRELARKTDIMTFEFEHIDVEILSLIENEGSRIIPSSRTLKVIQNKYNQKNMLQQIGVKVPEFRMINSIDDLMDAFNHFNQKAILKSCTNGYDGKGNMIIKNVADLESIYHGFDGQMIMIEELIDFIKEVSIVVAKSDLGVFFYPVVENIHQNSILIKTLVPSSIPDEVTEKIRDTSKKIVDSIDDFGVYCIEFFIDKNLDVIVNEIAPRPHNSGHYTIECCSSSQFEQLVRIICGMPIGSTYLRTPCVMYNLLGSDDVKGKYEIRGLEGVLNIPDCYFHLYGKPETDNLKKIGHLTVLGETVDAADKKANIALQNIKIHQK